MDISSLSAVELGRKIKQRELSCQEAVAETVKAAKTAEPHINAFITFDAEGAMVQAENVQEKLDEGMDLSPLAGVPMGYKDNICTEGVLTTSGSKMLENFNPTYNATVVEKLTTAGAVSLGKLNMDEFSMGSTTETSYYHSTKNPWDLSKTPGGSSGGPAAAVAAGEVFYAVGSDTGGSIRQPCSFCGVSGIKPTYGTVSRYGLIAYASSMDQIGPVGRTIEDCAEVLTIIAGHDCKDGTSRAIAPYDFSGCYTGRLDGMKIGLPENYLEQGLDGSVKDAVLESAQRFKTLGASVEFFHLPLMDYTIPAYYIIACAEASSNLARYDGIKYGYRELAQGDIQNTYIQTRSTGFGTEAKRRMMLGAFVLSAGYYDAYYKKALLVRDKIRNSFLQAFETYDLILGPTAPTTAFRLGEHLSDPLAMYLEDIYTVAVNLAGLPAASIPCGFDESGMPVGLQMIGKHFDEQAIIKAAYMFQKETDYHLHRPMQVKGANGHAL